jgi:ADP-ribosyl-[dinitrogen reductase] hydrolase
MVGGGPFDLKLGQWTDDTAMALCLADSLIEKKAFDARDQLAKYLRWYADGYNSCTGDCFDIGITTHTSIMGFAEHQRLKGVDSKYTAGNGSLMRLAPIAIYYCQDEELSSIAAASSETTHANKLCKDACSMYSLMLSSALMGCTDKNTVLTAGVANELELQDIAKMTYVDKNLADIEGTGYVVKSLEAALWCFYNTNTFKDAVLWAANLGDDADTTAAIVGQIAGAFYGIEGIPAEWVKNVAWSDHIIELANKLAFAKGH